MSNDAGQALTLGNIIKQTGGTLSECQSSISTILDHLGLGLADKKDPGVSQGGSVLNIRIGEVDMLNQRGRMILEDLIRIEEELRIL